ncbi:MAG: SEC-C metal-binding domain-containing protein [Elusimicrobiota bacterium]
MKKNTIKEVLDYYFSGTKYSKDAQKAFKIFFDKHPIDPEEKPDAFDEGALSEWFLYDYKLKNGRTPIEDYCITNPMGLEQEQLRLFEELCESIYGIWKVKNVIKGIGLELVSLQDKKAYNIKEHRGSMSMKKGDYIIGRVGQIAGIYELVGANPVPVSKEEAEQMIEEMDRLNPKKFRDYFYGKREERFAGLEGRVRDGGRCVCSICGKEGKIGGFANPSSLKPLIVCVDCMAVSMAKKDGVSVSEAKENRKRIFDNFHAFREAISEKYLEEAGKEIFDSIQEANMLIEFVQTTWNNLPRDFRETMEKESKEDLKRIYSDIDIDFSELLSGRRSQVGKMGRNDSCHCGSGKKYKYCCGAN